MHESIDEFFKFDPPKIVSRNSSYCLRDDEFGRQVLAGMNPLSIERLEVFPPTSKLDPNIYGPQESALKEEHIRDHIEGMSIQEALERNRLFILDYHDIYLPFLERINALDERKAYATRTIFFLTEMGTLKPIAIELTLPLAGVCTISNQVLTPPIDATTNWLWQLGKAHVCSNDAGVHQLVHHWLRTHACIEPFIIATHRQLSVMHPIFKLLHPHMRYTLKINAMARETLINAGGVIETDFTPGKYCMQLSCAAYQDWWRFDLEGLPADLIRRGLAIPDATQSHGLRLLIEDYPYASDGLLIWSSIEKLVRTYVNYYYQKENTVSSDIELQSWYKESINVGHVDLQQASWWPKLATPDDLTSILTTIIWITSAQHAALNFGQYPYGGHVPTRPPLMRLLIPKEQDPEYANFVTDPQKYFLSSLPSLLQATKFMAVIDIISAHSPDEEYIGERDDMSSWSGDAEIIDAFYRFSMEIKSIEKEIEKRNADPKLRNRCGAGVSPYELLIPSSGAGVTGRGVPKSITV
ncbi:Lipoxygenase [Quillaja saponaria]|uniref:Lipoxygenase n=1 Tax=Quillaja saponaria TaxID=32244 RepID=A0AAD7PUM5_QUISA|nr:Lipoxygenase [Quillaja saponaria]